MHYFKNFIHLMKDKGHVFFITTEDQEMAQYLLQRENIRYINRGKGKRRNLGKIIYMFQTDTLLLKHAKKFQPDIFIGFASFTRPR